MAATTISHQNDLTFYSLLAVLQSGMWLQSDIDKYLSAFGLSHGRYSILLSLKDSPDGTLLGNQLAAMLGVSKPTISKMVDRLIAEEHIEATGEDGDGRKKRYSVTKKGETLLGRINPGYMERLQQISASLNDHDKESLIEILSKINFLDPARTIIREKRNSISERSNLIKKLCTKGRPEDIDQVMTFLTADVDLPTTKVIDFYLGTVEAEGGRSRIEYYLFNGTQMQRNYCTLYFVRRDEWKVVKKAYGMGLIDYAQAFSK
jgi:DNA-binding MarR family transcriptional regulator